MKGKIVLVSIVMLLALLLMSNVIAQGPPSPPCVFYGYVTIGGKPAPNGSNVTAGISGTNLNWTTQTVDGTYGWLYKGSSVFEIPSQNPNATQKDGGVDGDTIQFYVQGTKISQTATFMSGNAQELNLSTSQTPNNGGTKTTDLNPFYAAVTVIAVCICAVAVFWVQRKRHRTRHHKSTSSK
jgi:hypothetical protein